MNYILKPFINYAEHTPTPLNKRAPNDASSAEDAIQTTGLLDRETVDSIASVTAVTATIGVRARGRRVSDMK